MASDGVNVEINFIAGSISPITTATKAIGSSIRSILASTKQLNSTINDTKANYNDARDAVREQQQVVRELRDELRQLQADDGEYVPTRKYEQLRETFERTGEAARELRESLRDVTGIRMENEAGINAGLDFADANPNQTVDFRGEAVDIHEAISMLINFNHTLNDTENSMDRLRSRGQAFEIRDNTAEIEATTGALGEAEAELSALNGEARGLGASLRGLKVLGIVKESIGKLAKASIVGLIKQVKELGNATRRSKSATDQLKGGFKTLIKYAFGVRSIYFLVRKLRSAIIDGYKTMAQVNGGANSVNQALSSMVSSLTYLKNAWSAAFSPIVTYVAPMLSSLMNMLAGVGNAVARFMATLTGQKVVMQATRANINYADSLDKSSKNAGKSAKANKKNTKSLKEYLNPLDEISKFDDNKDSKNGSGGGGGAGGYQGPTPDQQFKEIKGNNVWAERLKKAWKQGANSVYKFFYTVGRMLGTKLKEGMDKIPWSKIKTTAKKIAYGIAGFINGFFETPGLWQSVGTTIAEGINTALVFFNSLISKIHWDSIGKALSTALQTTIQKVNWKNVGKLISNAIIAGLNLITGLVKGIDWNKLPVDLFNAIKGVLTGFKWGSLVKSLKGLASASWTALSTVLGNAVGALVKGVPKIFNKLWTAIKNWATSGKYSKSVGQNIALGILNGIAKFFKSIAKWVKKNILTPFVKGFKNAFGIHSPAKNKQIVELGKNIILGVLNSMINELKNIGTWIKKNILTPMSEGFSNAYKDFKDAFSIGISLVQDGWTDFKSWLSEKAGAVGESIQLGVSIVKDKVDGMINWLWNSGKSLVTTLTAQFKEAGSTTIAALKAAWDTIKTKVVTLTAKAKNAAAKVLKTLQTAWTKLKDKVATFTGSFKMKATSVFEKLKSAWNVLKSKTATLVADIVNKTSSSVINTIKGAWNSISNKTVSLITKWSDKISGGLKSVKSAWESIKSKTVTITSTLKGTALSIYNKLFGKATGGAFYGGAWHKIAQYASGGIPSRGTMFVAGERGAEIVGNVNGRTEVLNQSQLASIMKAAVLSGMQTFASTLVNVGNTVISNIGMMRTDIQALNNTMHSMTNVRIPDIALGKIIPTNMTISLSRDSMNEFRTMFNELKSALQNNGNRSNMNYEFTAQLNRRTLFDEFISEAKLRQRQTGRNPLTSF